MGCDVDWRPGNAFGTQSTWPFRSMQAMAFGLGAVALLPAPCAPDVLAQSPVPSHASKRVAGCTAKHAKSGVSTQTTVDGNDVARTYLLQVPEGYSTINPYPVVFVFHGARGSAAQAHSWGLQDVKGAAASAIFVFPQGIDFHHQGVGWDDASRGYDITFFDRMLGELAANYCIDEDRIFVAGFSWGGDFATSLACSRGDRIRAIAVNSTDDEFGDRADFMTYRYLPCPAHRFPAVRFEHAVDGDSAYPAPYFATTAKLFQYLDRCSRESTPVPSTAGTVSCVSYAGCAQRVTECSFEKSIGHKLPSNWARDTWDFFQTFQHP